MNPFRFPSFILEKIIGFAAVHKYNRSRGDRMKEMKFINSGLRFLLEILALIILGYWGFHYSGIILGIGTPILLAVVWGTFGSPKAPYKLEGFSRLLLEIAVFGLAAVALYFTGMHSLAYIYGIISFINLLLMKLWKQ